MRSTIMQIIPLFQKNLSVGSPSDEINSAYAQQAIKSFPSMLSKR
jgi:hypothetical protein